ncbi:double zinc ribbon domain-containing protein [Paenibacillus cymbidii]|uniref:double zinc ribbon domain-containing protein n=1 Tax=Paenibacillus cymbidii TaxID=1639034 RepID=UPI001080A51E|nr:zinc ribbon domain-containing protein [Paenibacillus cymbidii]
MAVKTCPGCGEANKETALQCVVCSRSLSGVRLEGTPEEDKQFSGILSRGQAPSHCRECGEKLAADATRCKYCGSVVIRAPRRATAYYSGERSGGGPDGCALALLFVATVIIPLVGLIVGGIFAFSDDDDKRATGKGLLITALAVIFIYILIGILR